MLIEPAHADQGLLAWWRLAGAHTMVADTRAPWLRALDAVQMSKPLARSAPTVVPRTDAHATPLAPEVDAHAEALARACDSPAALAAAAREFAGPNALLFDGAVESGLLFVVDAPCPEDRARLLDGREGLLFDRMLKAIGRDRTRAGIATAALRSGAAPVPAFLGRLIALARPRALVALGGAATTILTGRAQGFNRLRGQWLASADHLAVFPTFHPAHLLQHPAHKALSWADLLTLMTKLEA